MMEKTVEKAVHDQNDPVPIKPVKRITTRFYEFSTSRIHCDKFQPSRTYRNLVLICTKLLISPQIILSYVKLMEKSAEIALHGKNDPVPIRPIERMTTSFYLLGTSRINSDQFHPSSTYRNRVLVSTKLLISPPNNSKLCEIDGKVCRKSTIIYIKLF